MNRRALLTWVAGLLGLGKFLPQRLTGDTMTFTFRGVDQFGRPFEFSSGGYVGGLSGAGRRVDPDDAVTFDAADVSWPLEFRPSSIYGVVVKDGPPTDEEEASWLTFEDGDGDDD